MLSVASVPSLFFSGLPVSDRKGVGTPRVVIGDTDDYGGFYIEPFDGQYLIDGKHIDADRGIIYISTSAGKEASTVVHEYRHHIQRTAFGCEFKDCPWVLGNDYKESIIAYFKGSPTEMDAMLYEVKHEPCDTNLQWYEWLLAA